MRVTVLKFALCYTLVVGLTSGRSSATTISAGDITLTVDAQARVTELKIGGTDISAGAEAIPFVNLCDVTKGNAFVPGSPAGGYLSSGLQLRFNDLHAKATLTCQSADKALRFTCKLKGDDKLPARGMLLRFAFPMNCEGWQWRDDVQTSREIVVGQVFENVRGLRAWADLPEWTDQPALRMGYSNRNFCTVLTGPVGVCVAVPLDQPRIFRTAYDASVEQLQIVFDFALSPDTREPNAASFAFDLYSCDPDWGFRSALARYYELYPTMFEVHVKKPGMWMAFTPLSQIDNANEFYFGLQEGAREPEYDDKIDVLDCTYFTHAGMGANIPNHNPEKDPLPPHDVQVKAMEAAFKRRTGMENVYHQVGLHNAGGKLDVRKWSVYAHLIAQFNLDPDLRYGRWHLERTAEQTQSIKARRGGQLDGFYYDGLTSGINYRTEHFKYSDAPPLWDPVAKKPLLNNFFSSCEFARSAAEMLRQRDQITMMNGALHASFYVAPWLDVLGSETGLRISREAVNYIRATTYHKPFMTLLKGNYDQQIGWGEMELFMRRAVAYGIFPGFFDWPPSGLGPGGRYWDHPEYYERDRDIFRKYLPLCQTLAMAGWEPVTYARSSNERVFIERFGAADDGIVWLTLLNEDLQPHTTTVTVDAKSVRLNLADIKCVDVLTNKTLNFKAKEGQLSADVQMGADGVMMIQLCSTQQAAAWRLAQSLDTLERGIIMREIDAEKPPIAVHWHTSGGRYLREKGDKGVAIVLDGTNRGVQRCWQWAMLFQPNPAPVKLRVRAAGEKLAGKGALGVHCRIAWVTRSYSHYENRFFNLPKGTNDYKDFEFTIECEHPLRAIYIEPQMAEDVTGKLKIASIRLSDSFGDDYVVDPELNKWYEPIPKRMKERLAKESGELRDAVSRARQAVLKDLTDNLTRDALLEIARRCGNLRDWIVVEKAQNGGRRALRDIETTEQHLGVALLAWFGVTAPEIVGPAKASPGDEVSLKFPTPAITGLPVKTELVSAGDAQTFPTADGAVLRVPDNAAPGTKLQIIGKVLIGPQGGAAAIRSSHQIEVVPPLDVKLINEGADPETGALKLRARIRNNRLRALTADVKLSVQEGWKAQGAGAVELPPGEERDLTVRISPTEKAAAGSVEAAALVTAGNDSARTSTTLLYIPKEANLIHNAGFEDGKRYWTSLGNRIAADNRVSHSGNASIRIHNASQSNRSQISQTVTLNQKQPCAILVSAVSRGENVSGTKNRDYSLYVDIYYTDGTPLYGQTYNFETGDTDWQFGELCIEPAKPIRNVNVYLLLRGKSGTAWSDDVAVMEDPRRKGNIAREAEVKVDSFYSAYDAEPINDGIIHPPEDAHWTDEAWASEESARDHFIELRFNDARQVERIAIYWSLDAGIPRTSAEVQAQASEGDAWRTVATATPARPAPMTNLKLEHPATARAFRIFQPKGKGPAGRPDLMWVREVELFPPRKRGA